MKLVDTDETVVIVTGSSPSAEERDRPLANLLKGEIDQRGLGPLFGTGGGAGDDDYGFVGVHELHGVRCSDYQGVAVSAGGGAVRWFC